MQQHEKGPGGKKKGRKEKEKCVLSKKMMGYMIWVGGKKSIFYRIKYLSYF